MQGTGGSPTVPDPENRVGNQDIGSPDRPVSSGLQVQLHIPPITIINKIYEDINLLSL